MNYQKFSKIYKCGSITESMGSPLFCKEIINSLENKESTRNGNDLKSLGKSFAQAYVR